MPDISRFVIETIRVTMPSLGFLHWVRIAVLQNPGIRLHFDHVRDWIKSLHSHLETRVQSLFSNNRALRACRDVANSNKHFELDLDSAAYRKHPPSVRELDYSAAPVASQELGTKRRLKVVLVAGLRIRVEDLADEAISALESFFTDHGLAP